jgi:urease accessory protein
MSGDAFLSDDLPAVGRKAVHQRAFGSLRVAMRSRDGTTVLSDLRQEGCLKARFPRPVDWTELVTLNTSGGIAGGDILRSEIVLAEGARATVASQAAERYYRALPADVPARVRTTITVGAGAAAEWLPQETIFFDRCAVDRVLDVDVAADGRFTGVESLVFGRAEMGEAVCTARISDTIRVRLDGTTVLHDAIRLTGPVAAVLARPAVANGGRAVATIVHVATEAPGQLDSLRAALSPFEAGASAWNGMLLARIIAADGATLRNAVVAGLQTLREGRSLPRVWMC